MISVYKPPVLAVILMCFVWMASVPAIAGPVSVMSTTELKDRLGDPDVIILDVRYGNDWTGAQEKIPGALRADPRKYKEWVGIFPKNKTIVVYCA